MERVKKIRDYAFVHFSNREDAVEAMKTLNGKVMQEKIKCLQIPAKFGMDMLYQRVI